MLPPLLIAFAATGALAQFITDRSDLKVVKSPADEDVTVSYREPDGACTTANESQKQYTGWVNLPGDYPTNLFFWFVEAREPTDSLTIWLNGGPGSSSMYGFFTGNGPCEVVETGLNEYDTIAREWGWDRASNMIFIDQPNQVGFSYDIPTDSTISLGTGEILPLSEAHNQGGPDWLYLNGTFSSQETDQTANTTEIAAIAVWHMLQGFLGAFPQYQPPTKGPVGVNLFAESYGGRYGPIFAETFEEQNEKRENGDLDRESTLDLHLISLGIVNGCIDREIQVPLYPVFANNNTYGVQVLSDDDVDDLLETYSASGGCKDLLDQCAESVADDDPDGDGGDFSTNSVCSDAVNACDEIETAYYQAAGLSAYDLSALLSDPFPSMMFLEYLNQESTLRAIGSPINYTMSSNSVYSEFVDTGDIARDGNVPRLAALLKSGVRVGLIYGDRDYICNWFGGEAVSKEVAKAAGSSYEEGFAAAGYEDLVVNDSYVGGAVRQFGNLSFSRIYQAGHAVPAYQPETAFQVFSRIMNGRSVATGEKADLSTYATEGDDEATETQDLPDPPEPTCFVRDLSTCGDDAYDLLNGEGDSVVINGVLYADEKDWPLANATKTSGGGAEASGSSAPSGTATDSADGDDAALHRAPSLAACCLALVLVLYMV